MFSGPLLLRTVRYTILAAVAQSCDALLDGRMRGKEAANAARDTETLDGRRQFGRLHGTQALQRADHGLGPVHHLSGTRIGTKFTIAAEGGHDDAGQQTESNVKHDARYVVANAGSVVFVAQNLAVNNPAD